MLWSYRASWQQQIRLQMHMSAPIKPWTQLVVEVVAERILGRLAADVILYVMTGVFMRFYMVPDVCAVCM